MRSYYFWKWVKIATITRESVHYCLPKTNLFASCQMHLQRKSSFICFADFRWKRILVEKPQYFKWNCNNCPCLCTIDQCFIFRTLKIWTNNFGEVMWWHNGVTEGGINRHRCTPRDLYMDTMDSETASPVKGNTLTEAIEGMENETDYSSIRGKVGCLPFYVFVYKHVLFMLWVQYYSCNHFMYIDFLTRSNPSLPNG